MTLQGHWGRSSCSFSASDQIGDEVMMALLNRDRQRGPGESTPHISRPTDLHTLAYTFGTLIKHAYWTATRHSLHVRQSYTPLEGPGFQPDAPSGVTEVLNKRTVITFVRNIHSVVPNSTNTHQRVCHVA